MLGELAQLTREDILLRTAPGTYAMAPSPLDVRPGTGHQTRQAMWERVIGQEWGV